MTDTRGQTGWQLRAARVLSELLQRAIREYLPPVSWTVGNAGAVLVARCHGRRGMDPRAEWEAWRAVLGAQPWPERTNGGGVVHLHAVAKDFDGLVDVAVIADVFPEDDQPEEASRP